jgi:hypothetical protein
MPKNPQLVGAAAVLWASTLLPPFGVYLTHWHFSLAAEEPGQAGEVRDSDPDRFVWVKEMVFVHETWLLSTGAHL